VEFPVHPVFAETLKKREVTPEVTPEVKRLLRVMIDAHSRAELQEMLSLKDAEHFRKAYLLPAIIAGLVEMTRPDKPKSRLQRYRLTTTGEAVLEELT
jgi:ATP-dependent DNA helicase RecG